MREFVFGIRRKERILDGKIEECNIHQANISFWAEDEFTAQLVAGNFFRELGFLIKVGPTGRVQYLLGTAFALVMIPESKALPRRDISQDDKADLQAFRKAEQDRGRESIPIIFNSP